MAEALGDARIELFQHYPSHRRHIEIFHLCKRQPDELDKLGIWACHSFDLLRNGTRVQCEESRVEAAYPAGDPVRRTATPETVGTIALDDVKSYYAAAYRPDLTTIVVIGDVTPEHARAAIEKWFGGWKANGPKPNIYSPAIPPNKPGQATIPATGRIQSEVRLGEVIPISYQDPDFPVLQLANTVLTGGFYASLLYHDLRELHGYVYNVGSSFTGGKNRSTFNVTYGADPQNVARAQRLVIDDLTGLQKKPLAADRLTRAKALILGELPIRKESYEGLAGQLIAYASTDRPLDQDRIDAQTQLAATPERIRAAMAKWIRPNDFVRIVTGPAGK